MSFTGSARRIWRKSTNTWVRLFVLMPLIALAWLVVTAWYLVFGILLVPYRLVRRSHRKGRQERLRHAEMLDALQKAHS